MPIIDLDNDQRDRSG